MSEFNLHREMISQVAKALEKDLLEQRDVFWLSRKNLTSFVLGILTIKTFTQGS